MGCGDNHYTGVCSDNQYMTRGVYFIQMTCYLQILKPYCFLMTPHCVHVQINLNNLITKLIMIWIAYVTGSRLINCYKILSKPITCFFFPVWK